MAKAVFTTKESSTYDDRPWEFYNFPRTYLNQVEQTVGDFVVYYEPRRTSSDPSSSGGKQAYFAVCSVTGIDKDPEKPDHFYARVDNYVRFELPVPFRNDGQYFENKLKREDGATNKGAFGRSVRIIPDNEFDLIVRAGFLRSLVFEDNDYESKYSGGLSDVQVDFERPVSKTLVSRDFRSRAFSLQVQDAYDNRCAVTGLKILNGGGRPEIEAAHIKPVSERGPDMVQNGIALSRTAHWMFDRGLISISNEMEILKSETFPLGDAERLINPDCRLNLPNNIALHPHPAFLQYHREIVFKG